MDVLPLISRSPDPKSWAAETGKLALRTTQVSTEREYDAYLRDVRNHLEKAPNSVFLIAGEPPACNTFEALLKCGARESAARRLAPKKVVGYLISRGPAGDVLVTMNVDGQVEEVSVSASDEGVAFAGALLRLIMSALRESMPGSFAPSGAIK